MIVKIVCYKISNKLNMTALASYFDVPYNEKLSNCILLKDQSISSIIKIHSDCKFLYIYEYGCVVFVDFSSDEIYSALGYLETITGAVNYRLISEFNEDLILSITDNKFIARINDFPCELKYNEDVLSIACDIISKSTALPAAEKEIITVLDEAENIVNYLQKAKLKINKKRFLFSISRMARFQHSTIKSLGLFGSTFILKRSSNSKSFYSILYHYYEIDDRTIILESKIGQVNRLISIYTTLSYNIEEMRQLILECILLALFLLPDLIDFKAFFK
ncbi:MAG TPA: RMD1 family protein [Ruminiclostridium sp.]